MNKKIPVLFASLFLISIFFSSTAYAEANLASKLYVELGKKEFKARKYERATIAFHKALLAEPDNEEAMMYLRILTAPAGGKESSVREQEPAAKQNKKTSPESKKAETKKSKTAKTKTQSAVKAGSTEDKSSSVDVDESAKIEAQLAKEEAAALEALRVETAKKEKAALKKTQTGAKQEKKKPAKSSAKPAAAKGTAPAAQSGSGHAELSKESGAGVVDVEKFLNDLEPVKDEFSDESAEAAAPTPAEREAALTASFRKQAVAKATALERKIDAETDNKIAKVHKKFAATPPRKNEKMVSRDFDGDGVPEKITVKESAAIKKIEDQAAQEKQSGLKKIRTQAVSDKNAALKKLRADIRKEEKLNAKNKSKDKTKLKAGDVVVSASEDAGAAALDLDAEEGDVETAELADIKADAAAKEKDIQLQYAKKKALRLAEAEKKAKTKPEAQEEKVSLTESEADDESADETVDELLVDTEIPASTPKAVQVQNTVLKKKLAQAVEMSQKDQDVIKSLENDVAEKDEKVDALESDLHETKTNLDAQVELIKQKEEKLQDLSERIAAMESDVNSKQYDFKDKQIEYEKKLQAIQEEFGNYKAERTNNEEELKEQLKTLKEALAKKIAELNDATEKLIFTENKLKNSEEKYIQTAKQYEDVKKTLADLEDRLGGLSSETALADDQAPLVTVDPQNLPPPQNHNEVVYQQWIKRQDQLVSKLKDKLLWAREQMEFLGRYDIKLSDQKMAALKEQLVAVKKQLSAQPTGRTAEDFALMEGRLKDSQERLEMVEKILHEKDDQVKELEKQLNQVLTAF